MATEPFNISLDPAEWPTDTRERYAYLEQLVRRYDCLSCKSQPRIAQMALLTGEMNYGLRCNCWTAETKQLPTLASIIHHVDERRWNMVENSIEKRPQDLARITESDVRRLIAPTAEPAEVEVFVLYCIREGLNPFAREAHLVKIPGQPAYIVVDYKVLFKRAARDPKYVRYTSGLIAINSDGEMIDRPSAVIAPKEELYGGWCKVYMVDVDEPIEARVLLRNFQKRKRDGSLTTFWSTMPEFMIEKVAITTAFKRCVSSIDTLMESSMRVETAEVEHLTADALEAPAKTPKADPTTGGLYEAPAPESHEEPIAEAPSMKEQGELSNSDVFNEGRGEPESDGESDGGTNGGPPSQASKPPEAKPHKFANMGEFRKALDGDFGLNTKPKIEAALKALGLPPLDEVRNIDEAWEAIYQDREEQAYRKQQAEPVENTEAT